MVRRIQKSSHANRGSALEDLVYISCIQYYNAKLLRIDKFPVPVKILQTNNCKSFDDSQTIKSKTQVIGYLEGKSTVDYIGAIKGGRSICFDAKETNQDNIFPLKNIHAHQVDYMKDISELGGIAFLIVCFSKIDRYFRMDYKFLRTVWDNWVLHPHTKGFASVTLSDMEKYCFEIKPSYSFSLNFLDGLIPVNL